jgi:hypothetical protein
VRFVFESEIVLFCFSFIFASFRKSRLLVSWCAGGRCGMACIDKDCGRSRRPGAEDRRWSHKSGTRWLGDQEVGWCHVQSAPCTWRQGAWISWLNLKTKVDGLLVVWPKNHSDGFSSVWASKPMAMVCEWFDLKTTRMVSHMFGPQNRWQRFMSGLASKPVVTVSGGLASKIVVTVSDGLSSKPDAPVSSGLASKPAATVSPSLTSKPVVGFLVEPQNQGGGGLPSLGLKIDNYDLVI